MKKTKLAHRLRLRLRASSLVEVLIAMVILLSVFAVGMLIFANLTASSTSQRTKVVRLQLGHIQHLHTTGEAMDNPMVIDSIAYYVEEEYLLNFVDRKRVTIYAERLSDGYIVDSLSRIHVVGSVKSDL